VTDSADAVPAPGPVPPQRVAPVPPEKQDDRLRELLSAMPRTPDGTVMNLFATLAHHPGLLKRWTAYGGLLLQGGKLPGRDRELAVLRTAWNTGATYEWEHHVSIGRQVGLTDEEITRVGRGPEDPAWSAADASLLRAADELHSDARITDATWSELAGRYDEAQLVELCMLVGQYHTVAFALNSLGIQLEEERGTHP
jgi:4-carboxymuconolactone decarboxylase